MKNWNFTWFGTSLFAASLFLLPSGTSSAEVRVTLDDWRISKPSKSFKDLPVLYPRTENGFDAGIGLLQFVCLEAKYFLLLVQPSIKLEGHSPSMLSLRTTELSGDTSQVALKFYNLYKTKPLLSRKFERDADIYYAELDLNLLTPLQDARELTLQLASHDFVFSLNTFGSRLKIFRKFCDTGVIETPAYFDTP